MLHSSATVHFEVCTGDSSIDAVQSARSILAGLPYAMDCLVNVYAKNNDNVRALDALISAWSAVRFGDSRAVPKLYYYTSAAEHLQKPAICELLNNYNKVTDFLNIVLTVDANTELTDAHLETITLLEKNSISYDVLFCAESADEFPMLFKRHRDASVLSLAGKSNLLYIKSPANEENIKNYKYIFEVAPLIQDKLTNVPRLPAGYLDAIYCASKLAEYVHETGGAVKHKSVLELCKLLRSNNYVFVPQSQKFQGLDEPSKGYVAFAQFVDESLPLRAMFCVDSLSKVRKTMRDFVND